MSVITNLINKIILFHLQMVNNIYDRGGEKSRQTEAAFQHTNLEHNCKLSLKSSPYPKNLTNIICTVGKYRFTI